MTLRDLPRLAPLALALTLAACGGDDDKDRPQTFTLTVEVAGDGEGDVAGQGIDCGGDCTETYAEGTVVTLTADPGAGFAFDSWAGCPSSNGDTCTATMSADMTVTAAFTVTFR